MRSPSYKMMTVNERADRAFVLKNMIQQIKFDSKNVDEIHANFLYKADDPSSGMIGFDGFCEAIGEDKANPICSALFKLFDPDRNEDIDFRDFLISVVHLITDKKDLKVQYAFNIFDLDGNGNIDES